MPVLFLLCSLPASVPSPAQPEEPARVWCPACAALLPPGDVTRHVTERHGGRLECGCCLEELEGTAAARHCTERHTANYLCIVSVTGAGMMH